MRKRPSSRLGSSKGIAAISGVPTLPELNLRVPGLTQPGNPAAQKMQFSSRDEALEVLCRVMLKFLRSPLLLEQIKTVLRVCNGFVQQVEYEQRNPGKPSLLEEVMVHGTKDDYTLQLKQIEDVLHLTRSITSDYIGEWGAEIKPQDCLKLMTDFSNEKRETHYDLVYKEVAQGLSLTEAIIKVDPSYDQLHGDERQDEFKKCYKGVGYSAKKYGRSLSAQPRRKKKSP